MPRAGDVLAVGRDASVQFGFHPIRFRVIRVMEDETRDTYADWAWIDGYELGANGEAVERRQIFVQPAGLRWVEPVPDPPARPGRVTARLTNTRNTRPIPRPRPPADTTTTGRTR